jgi:SAM-dependent methyltransferase
VKLPHPSVSDRPVLPVRAWHAWRGRGTRYVWHKALRRALGRWPGLKRRLVYADARSYWTLRGGDEYFGEQEGQAARAARARWLAERVARYRPGSILEVGCGYGKQLRALRGLLDVPLVGLDFSPTQLRRARGYLGGLERIDLVLGSGQTLPFADGAFDLVLTSAVILHNPPAAAERIRREVLRVARRWAAHNEDTDVSYNRYGYDTAAWYRSAGIPLAESGPIPTRGTEEEARVMAAPSSQFCVANLWRP